MAVDVAIPEQIIMEEILPRVPIKSMLHWRCVCKSWNSKFCNPEFLSHMSCRRCSCISQNPERDNDDDYLIFMINYYCSRATPRYVISLLSHKRLRETQIEQFVPYPSSLSEEDIHLVGSINGLVCLAFYFEDNHHFVLWNPAIRFYKKISAAGMHTPYSLMYGFGWDSVTDDYKLVAAKPRRGVLSAIVYSCKTDCWTNVKSLSIYDFFYIDTCEPPCVIVNGSPYWNYWGSGFILKFDTSKNEFTYLNTDFLDKHDHSSLINLNDSLACIRYGDMDKPHVIQYDEQCNTWRYMYSISKPMEHRDFKICFKYSEDILFCKKARLYLYSRKSDYMTRFGHYPKPKCGSCQINPRKTRYGYFHDCKGSVVNGFTYNPSLVALPGMKALPLRGPS